MPARCASAGSGCPPQRSAYGGEFSVHELNSCPPTPSLPPFVRAIAEAYGGRIEVDRTPGEGSFFRLWLPLLLPAGVAHEYVGFSDVRAAAVN